MMPQPIRYKLEVRLSITKEEWDGPLPIAEDSPQGYWRPVFNNERLSVEENLILGSMDFMQMMGVLGQLHDTLQALPHGE